MSSVALLLAAAGAAGALLAVSAWRPALACAVLALAVPVSAGLERGAVLPVLRVNEALLLVVTAGFLVHWLTRRRPLAFTGLDVVILGFCLANVVIPWAVILLSHDHLELDGWLVVLGPIQYLVVYTVYSRTGFTGADLRLFLNLCMLASIPVAAVAVAESLDVAGARGLVAAYYPAAALPAWDTVYRPASLLGHYSAVGAFGLLNFLLALALAATRHPGFSWWWLALVMGANLLSLIASLTYAPLAALPLGAAAVLLVARNVPWRQLAAGPPVLAACAVALWPIIGGRIDAQFSLPGGFGLPETLQTRVDYWQGFFLPALIQHGPWLGTGTLIPPEVPRPLVAFVDNGYLWQLFRAGIPGLAVLIATLVTLASAGWAARRSEEPSHRTLGAVCLGAVVSVVLIDMTSEYLTFTAVSQEFWMLVGLLSGAVLLRRPARAAPVLELRPEPAARPDWGAGLGAALRPVWAPRLGAALRPVWATLVGGALRPDWAARVGAALRPVWAALVGAALRPDWAARVGAVLRPVRAVRLGAALRRLAPERVIVRASVAVLLGFGLARALGFLFQVIAGRTLAPEGYGRFTYALAVANVAAVLLTTTPLGLSRFLSRSAGNRAEQAAYFVNWLAVVGLVLGVSAVVTAAFATPVGLGGWMLVGLLANLLGATALEMYREVQRGLGKYTLQSVFFVLANVVQLAAVLVAASLGWVSPALFLIVYGLSATAALAVMSPLSRGLRLDRTLLRWRRMLGIVAFIRPVLLQAIFWNIWFSADLLMLQHVRTATETGTYAAAKTIANGFTLVPTAIAFVFAPRVAQLAESEVRGHLVRVLGLTAVVTVPLAIAVMAAAGPLTSGVFGGRFAGAAIPLVILAAGMLPYGLKSVLGGLWLGLGHPVVETVSSGFAMVVTVATGLWLIPAAGPAGAAAAFSGGALAMLMVNGAVTVWAFGARTPRVMHLGDRRIIEDEPPPDERHAREEAEAIRPPALVVAEELTATPDEGYVTFVRMLESGLAARRPTLLHATPGHRTDAWKPLRAIDRIWKVIRATRSTELRKTPPEVIVYVSRSSLTLPALVRGALLKRLCGGAPLAVIALQAQTGGRLARRVQGLLAPDLLFVSTERERDAARAAGLNADTISSGVDLVRFRPATGGEKDALRRKWELPLNQRVVLHVGHLRGGRNLGALVPLAQSPGVTVVVAASAQRGPESEALREELEAHGVVVIDGYRPDIEELYRLADCYVFPTVAPDNALAMPLSVLEALASDLPVVSTRFGALPERFDSAPGLELVERSDQLPERVLAASLSRAQPRRLAEPYSWDAIVGRFADLLEELRLEHRAGGAAPAFRPALIAASVRRLVVYRKGLLRLLLWRTRLGYQPREPSTAPIVVVEEPAPLPGPGRPDSDHVGIIGPHVNRQSSPVAAAADFLGLSVEAPAERDTEKLLDRAAEERWRLVTAPVEAVAALPEAGRAALATFVSRGGTLLIDGVDQRSTGGLRQLAARLGFPAPVVREAPRTRYLLFPGEQAAFARELAGTRLETACQRDALEPESEQEVLAFSLCDAARLPAVVQRRVGLGRIVLSALGRARRSRLSDVMASNEAGAAVVPLLLLRELYGKAAWHAPTALANFSIDDPALRRGMLGLRYDLLVAQARDHGFHVTIATVPRELALAGEAVVRRLREQPGLLSACYHGCDHDGYEFYLTQGSKTRYAPRPLDEQRRALRRAVEHASRHARRHHHELDRVMVFPYGVGPASLFPDLHRLGFLASCNYGDKYPLEAPVPADPDLGVRPADLAWEGFPLLWRRGLDDGGYLLDFLLGRPVLLFAHCHALGADYRPIVERASVINRALRGAAVWRGLDEVARHAYLQRDDPTVGWSVLMTTNEACLHNPDAAPRTYKVRRPHMPHGSRFEVDGVPQEGGQPLSVTVPAGGIALLRLVAAGSPAALRGRRGCSVFPTAARLDATTEMTR